MSSFVLNDESTAMLATFFDRIAQPNIGTVRKGCYNYRDLYFALAEEYEKTHIHPTYMTAERIYTVLREFNERAFNGRYNKTPAKQVQEMPKGTFLKDVENKPFQVLKTLECYLYQCDEEATRESRLFQVLKETCDHYRKFLINKIPEYSEAIWG